MLSSKKDFQDCLEEIIRPLENYFIESKAGIKCGATGVQYGEETALLEAFARLLWGLAPLWAGKGDIKGFEEIYLEGIINGTDPNHKDYWGSLNDNKQRLVETAPIGLALMLAPEKIWYPLTKEQKENLRKWISEEVILKNSGNWLFFSVLVNIGLKNVGEEYDRQQIEEHLKRIDGFYVGGGWYTDGPSKRKDYYIPFAMHFYGLIYAKVMEKEDPERSRVFKERAKLFAKDFIYYFADNGASVAFGRSLTYRFAQVCFWSACIFAGIEPFPMGVMKGIISRHLEYWLNQPIFDNGGILTVGYAYPNLNMSEGYNAFGSPYWALKAFLILALDDDHEFFKAEPLPLPELDSLHVMKEAEMVIQRIGGYVTLLPVGQSVEWLMVHKAERYSKFAYTSEYGFSVPRSYDMIDSAGTDSMLTFIKDGICRVRNECKEYHVEDDGTVYSKWSPYNGIDVETYIIPTPTGHIRKHIIESTEDVIAYDCAFATPDEDGTISGDGENVVITCVPNTNLIYSNPTTMKAIKYELKKGKTAIETIVDYPVIQK